MMKLSGRLLFVFFAALALNGISGAASGQEHDVSSVYNFTVWLDDKPIGYHRVSVTRQANRKTVHTQADIDVRMLFIPVYSYEHETREHWVDNCLVDISSTTDDNGDDYFISSMPDDAGLALDTRDGVTSIDGCVRTFAYWDIRLLQSERLLNQQTGEYLPAAVTDLGTATLDIDDVQISARRFRLAADEQVFDLWYTSDLRWLALESVTESGAVLRYLPEKPAAYSVEADS